MIFTLSHELNTAVLNNKKVMLDCLFGAASNTLLNFGKKELGGKAGFLANRNRKANLAAIRGLLGCPPSTQECPTGLEEMMFRLKDADITVCPHCKKGKMRVIEEVFIRARGPTCLNACAG